MEAAIYARISKDWAGEGLGVQRQQDACLQKATALGWAVGETYIDNDVSASKDVRRPQYERLMSDIEQGLVKALVVYDLDRLTRRPAELETFIEAADKYGVALANVSGDVDLTNANGRMVARIKGAVARQEAERIGERNKAQKAQRAAMGLPMGTRYRVYGYNRDWSVRDDEATVVRDLFDRYIGGESQKSLTRWMQEQGHLTTAGKQWSERASNRLLTNAMYAGVYVFKGERIGKSKVPAIVDEATFEAANASRVKGVSANTRKWLLSGIVVCDACKAPMIGSRSGGKKPRYRCNIQQGGCGRLSIDATTLDGIVNSFMSNMVMLEGARERDAATEVEADTPEDTRLAGKDAEIEAIQESELDLADKVALLQKARRERLALVREQAQAVERVNVWKPLEDYDGADISVKRAAIRRYIKHIFVRPVSGKLSRQLFATRLLVLMGEAHPSAGDLVNGIGIDSVDLRDPVYKEMRIYEADQQPL